MSSLNVVAEHDEVKGAADDFLAWQVVHIAASVHNLVVSTIYALTSHFKDTVLVMPKLGFAATMHSSGKSTAAQAVLGVGNFSPLARHTQKMSAPGAIRLANDEEKGVRLEDIHRYRPHHDIFDFMVNSLPQQGKHVVANVQNQKKFVVYEIGGTPIIFTTNAVHKLDPDARRRSIILPMIRQKPGKYATYSSNSRLTASCRKSWKWRSRTTARRHARRHLCSSWQARSGSSATIAARARVDNGTARARPFLLSRSRATGPPGSTRATAHSSDMRRAVSTARVIQGASPGSAAATRSNSPASGRRSRATRCRGRRRAAMGLGAAWPHSLAATW